MAHDGEAASDLLTVAQAAEVLQMRVGSVHQAIKDGRLPAQRVGFVWLLRRADVAAYGKTPRHAGGRPRKPADSAV